MISLEIQMLVCRWASADPLLDLGVDQKMDAYTQ